MTKTLFELDPHRRTGRTLAMVRAIPHSGAVIVVHNTPMKKYVENMIGDVRGRDVLVNSRVVVCINSDDVAQLQGFHGPVLCDHAFYNSVREEIRHEVARICETQGDAP